MIAFRQYLESAYYAAGVLLLFGLVIALFQLLLIKNDIRSRNERAAKEREKQLVDTLRVLFLHSILIISIKGKN